MKGLTLKRVKFVEDDQDEFESESISRNSEK